MFKSPVEPVAFRALVVDDEKSIREALCGVLGDEGWDVGTASNGQEAVQRFVKSRPDIVLLDVWMPVMDGIETLQRLKDLDATVPIVIMSGHSTIETAVKCTKLGAFDFLEKPLSLDKILPMLGHAKAMRRTVVEDHSKDPFPLIGESEAIQKIRKQIDMVASRNAWVLITGENGTGKEIVARNLHAKSSRASKPFIAVNCAAIPEELIESELFGHDKGAFTNALATRKGRFELAHQGTLFLDEIGDMSLKTQAKILRILQEQSFERIGSSETIHVDVRVIAATNKNLAEEIKKSTFREDLYYRLNVVPFHIPELKDRDQDVLLLSQFFLNKIAQDMGDPQKTLSYDVQQEFLHYDWPGNVRELKNFLERLCIMVPDPEIQLRHLEDLGHALRVPRKDIGASAKDNSSLKQAKTDFERAFILGKLEEFQWNVSKTAEAIGIERSNLHRKLKAYEIDPRKLKG